MKKELTIEQKRELIISKSVDLDIDLLDLINDTDYANLRDTFNDIMYREFCNWVYENENNWDLVNDEDIEDLYEEYKEELGVE